MSTTTGQYNVSTPFKSTVAPAKFTHTLSGMTAEEWNNTDVQTSFRETVAEHMGETVTTEDVTITSFTILSRRTGGVAVNHSVALTNSSQAKHAVSGLHNATNSGSFANSLKNNAANKGVGLNSGVSAGVTGTTPSDVQTAINNQNQQASTENDKKDKWEATGITFMCLTGLALIGLAVYAGFLVKRRKGHYHHADLDHASHMNQGFDDVHARNDLYEDTDINEADDAICQQDAPTPTWMADMDNNRERADSSTTVRVNLNEITDKSGQI